MARVLRNQVRGAAISSPAVSVNLCISEMGQTENSVRANFSALPRTRTSRDDVGTSHLCQTATFCVYFRLPACLRTEARRCPPEHQLECQGTYQRHGVSDNRGCPSACCHRTPPLSGYIPWLWNTLWQLLLSLVRFCCKHCCTALSSPNCLRQKRCASRVHACCSCGVPIWP
jgi:hypothetical protein